jgi:hypothetical protein
MIGPLSSRPTIITNKRELNPKEIAARIIKVAQSYIGKTEKPNNGGFTDPTFEKRMREMGFSYRRFLVCPAG